MEDDGKRLEKLGADGRTRIAPSSMSSSRLSFLFSARSVWNPGRDSPSLVGGGWATGAVLCFLFLWQLLKSLFLFTRRRFFNRTATATSSAAPSHPSSSFQLGLPVIITDAELGDLINDLKGEIDAEDQWENVINKCSDSVSYNAKCCRKKGGPIKYLSTTTFEKCSTELLKDFYMDNEYRKKWDKTVLEHERLEVDEIKALEVGRTIKKFPLLTPREYILVWRLWEGKDKSYFCLIKDLEYPNVPIQKKYVRVRFFRSGWHIKKVPGRDACEITMVHQEDAGLNIELAKLAFAKGIWNYITKMNIALRQYSHSVILNPSPGTVLRIVPVPSEFESDNDADSDTAPSVSNIITSSTGWPGNPNMSARRWIGKGVLLVGGLFCLSRGGPTLATQLAMACFLKKLAKKREATERNQQATPEVPQSRWYPRHSSKFQRSSSFTADQLSPRRLQTKQ